MHLYSGVSVQHYRVVWCWMVPGLGSESPSAAAGAGGPGWHALPGDVPRCPHRIPPQSGDRQPAALRTICVIHWHEQHFLICEIINFLFGYKIWTIALVGKALRKYSLNGENSSLGFIEAVHQWLWKMPYHWPPSTWEEFNWMLGFPLKTSQDFKKEVVLR